MSALRRFWRLGASDRKLLLKAAILLAGYRIALWLFPWNRVAALQPLRDKSPATQVSVERLEWSVRTASRTILGASCLTKALALHHLLSHVGYESTIQIGVANTDARGFEAHAWVEHDGVALLSSPGEIAHYARLHAFKAPTL